MFFFYILLSRFSATFLAHQILYLVWLAKKSFLFATKTFISKNLNTYFYAQMLIFLVVVEFYSDLLIQKTFSCLADLQQYFFLPST